MTNGVKYDDGKLDYTLLPYEALQEVVKVLMYGAKKYPEADNWKRVSDPRKRYNKAAFRHLFSEVNGETLDKESGLYHLAHAVCSNLFALHFAIQKNKNHICYMTLGHHSCAECGKSIIPYMSGTHRTTATMIVGKCYKCNGSLYSEIQHMCDDG